MPKGERYIPQEAMNEMNPPTPTGEGERASAQPNAENAAATSRREFLKKGVLGAAALAVEHYANTPNLSKKLNAISIQTRTEHKVEETDLDAARMEIMHCLYFKLEETFPEPFEIDNGVGANLKDEIRLGVIKSLLTENLGTKLAKTTQKVAMGTLAGSLAAATTAAASNKSMPRRNFLTFLGGLIGSAVALSANGENGQSTEPESKFKPEPESKFKPYPDPVERLKPKNVSTEDFLPAQETRLHDNETRSLIDEAADQALIVLWENFNSDHAQTTPYFKNKCDTILQYMKHAPSDISSISRFGYSFFQLIKDKVDLELLSKK